jgi:CBS domain containing-hemolysin-like protein
MCRRAIDDDPVACRGSGRRAPRHLDQGGVLAPRQKQQRQTTVTEEEIKMLIAEGERAGVLETGEHRMISGVLRLGDRPLLELLRDAEVPMALIHDEYGHFEGVVTPADILEAIAGAFRSDADTEEPAAVPRDDGSWLLAGWMPADEMADQLGITLPARREYQSGLGSCSLPH